MAESPYKFLNDRPVKEDAIGHYQIIADQLFETLHCNLEKPFVIGLFGSWGIGKSSIIEMLEDRCKKEKTRKTKVVVVDAWRKEKSIFNRQFLKKLGKELLKKSDYDEVRDDITKKVTDNRSTWKPTREGEAEYKKYRLFVLLLVLGTIVYWHLTKNYQQVFPVDVIASAALVWLVARYFQYTLPKYSITTDSTTEDISVHDIDHFRKIYFDKIIGKTEAQCVCIVVDNLDRVEAEDALAIMRTLKTFIVDAKEDKGTGEEVEENSLNKVIFIVPCCDEELKSTICHIVSQTYCKNPRKAKIFLNNFLMIYNVAKACEEAGKIEQGIITNHPDWLAISIAHKEQEQDGGIEVYISS